jgi:hypothetical protein
MDPYGGNQRRQRKKDDFSTLPYDVHAVLLFEDIDHDRPPLN